MVCAKFFIKYLFGSTLRMWDITLINKNVSAKLPKDFVELFM